MGISAVISSSIAVRAFASYTQNDNTLLVVNEIVDVGDSSERNFEMKVEGKIVTSGIYKERVNNIVTLDLIANLPEISLETKQHLEEWKDFLLWRREIIHKGFKGLRVVKVSYNEKHILVYVVADEKDMDKFRQFLRQDLAIFPLEYSSDPWRLVKSEMKRTVRGEPLGEFRRFTY